MIFATIGTQLPFPRLLQRLDQLAETLGEEIIAQIGRDPGVYRNLRCYDFLDPPQFAGFFRDARIIVAHAGIGTLLAARKAHKPLVILPRRAALGEHRNDHQLATARFAAKLTGVHLAEEVDDLAPLLARTDLAPAEMTPSPQLAALTSHLRDFIAAG